MEIEAKYALPDEDTGLAILDAPYVRDRSVGTVHIIRMESTYYCDHAGKLDAGGFTLRLRRENGRGVCCLKQDVSKDGGIKKRYEQECAAETIEDGVRGLMLLGVPSAFAEAVRDVHFMVAAQVQFVRRSLLLELDGACAELAFDAGAFGKTKTVPFYELEVEWKSGAEGPFEAFLRDLEREFSLTPQNMSKYARAKAAESGILLENGIT